ncbi:MAG: MOSC domain-containing protein [Acidobacteria bacterium]|nr:MOSC domain-containing protein [Acidobacteriota bacterium]MCA1651742.1 MOSC domain-containing protein [Acidobacteriota bacterium]
MNEGVLLSINVSDGGVPKHPRQECVLRVNGIEGDRQAHPQIHGGPQRAVCLYSLELIESLRSEGHPVTVGSLGENLTLAGIPWHQMVPGTCVDVGAASLELTGYADPCRTIVGSFHDRRSARIFERVHPGWSRLYARVMKEGSLRIGDPVHVAAPLTQDAEDAGGTLERDTRD